MRFPDRYLGDGVYASFDGYQVWLRAEREDGTIARIAVEDDVIGALLEYRRHIARLITGDHDDADDVGDAPAL